MNDLIEIPWKYEYIDLNGWIPDFILDDKLLIEVKPTNINIEHDYIIKRTILEIENATDQKTILVGLDPLDNFGIIVNKYDCIYDYARITRTDIDFDLYDTENTKFHEPIELLVSGNIIDDVKIDTNEIKCLWNIARYITRYGSR